MILQPVFYLVEDIILDQIKDIEKSADTEIHKPSPETRVNEKSDSNLKDPRPWHDQNGLEMSMDSE